MPSLSYSEHAELETKAPSPAVLPEASFIDKLAATVRGVLPAAFRAKPLAVPIDNLVVAGAGPSLKDPTPESLAQESLAFGLAWAKSPESLVRWHGARSLGRLAESPEALAGLLGLVKDLNYIVREATTCWLGNFPSSPEALQALLGLAEDKNSGIRSAAAGSLKAFPASPEAFAALIGLALDEYSRVREAAVDALKAFPK